MAVVARQIRAYPGARVTQYAVTLCANEPTPNTIADTGRNPRVTLDSRRLMTSAPRPDDSACSSLRGGLCDPFPRTQGNSGGNSAGRDTPWPGFRMPLEIQFANHLYACKFRASIPLRMTWRQSRIWLAHGIFLLAGMAGLGCQLVWTRMFLAALGHEMPALVAVVAAFMCGLALGAGLLDRPIGRSRRPAHWFAACKP
jgi:hypothetical protein